jgi:excisionase family DNA binding protein
MDQMLRPPDTSHNAVRGLLQGHREFLKRAKAFVCMCCQRTKATHEASGAFVYKTDDPKLLRVMNSARGPRVGTYILCTACVESYPDHVIQEKATACFFKAGLFGPASDLRNPDLQGLLQDLSPLRSSLDMEKKPTTTPGDPWHTLTTAAKYTHLSKGFLSRVIRKGELRAAHVGIGKQRHHYLLRQSWIDTWIESRASGGSV